MDDRLCQIISLVKYRRKKTTTKKPWEAREGHAYIL